ncbi:hypothetical protein LEP1GSC115_5008 [Leptospira interrogans serovar Australis str. 200703203]|uniref:Uncharacterized protein n=1 Tax=Leptospira interrogans serovar Australis str. 200703203 TaxID=1085541 RepID=N1UHX6_LEPIR|nr:hypothetical protein LEP1GSC115_5008 [Leptospira interrogans serovar Australis str. 200703203]
MTIKNRKRFFRSAKDISHFNTEFTSSVLHHNRPKLGKEKENSDHRR